MLMWSNYTIQYRTMLRGSIIATLMSEFTVLQVTYPPYSNLMTLNSVSARPAASSFQYPKLHPVLLVSPSRKCFNAVAAKDG
jgi:hypothetical protein